MQASAFADALPRMILRRLVPPYRGAYAVAYDFRRLTRSAVCWDIPAQSRACLWFRRLQEHSLRPVFRTRY